MWVALGTPDLQGAGNPVFRLCWVLSRSFLRLRPVLGAQASEAGGVPRCRAQALARWLQKLQLSASRAQAQDSLTPGLYLFHAMWDLPRPRDRTSSPAMARRIPIHCTTGIDNPEPT